MDPLSNRVTLIQNAQRASRSRVTFSPRTGCNSSHAVFSLLRVLRDEGFLEGVEKVNTKQSVSPNLRVHLKYGSQGEPAIRRIFRVSTTGRRIYVSSVTLWQPQTTVGLLILSTSQGRRTDREARQRGLGGEVILGVRLFSLVRWQIMPRKQLHMY